MSFYICRDLLNIAGDALNIACIHGLGETVETFIEGLVENWKGILKQQLLVNKSNI